MKIEEVKINTVLNHIEVLASRLMIFPLSKLKKPFSSYKNISEFFIDEELGCEAVTLISKTGEEESIHLDSFLEINSDPEYFRNLFLYELTSDLVKVFDSDGLVKKHVAAKLDTSMAQLYRVLDTTNYSKTLDQVIKTFAAIGYKVNYRIEKIESNEACDNAGESSPFGYLDKEDILETPNSSEFVGLKLAV